MSRKRTIKLRDGAVDQMVRDFCLDSRARRLRDATRITVAVSDLVA